MLQYSNLMTGGVGLYCDVLVAVGFACCQVTHDCRYLSKSAFFDGVGHFERKFQTEGVSLTNHCRCQKTRVIALSCGIKISAVHCLVSSQSMRVSDRRTDGQTGRITTPKTALT